MSHASLGAVGVVGAGRVGAALAARLRAAGCTVSAVSGASAASQLRIDTLLPGVRVATPAQVAESSDIVVLAVPDDVLADVVEQLAPYVRDGQYVVHTSGRHGLAALDAVAIRGARPIALHPAMTFTGTDVDLTRTCVFGVTAHDEDRAFAAQLVAAIGGTIEWIDEADRVAYHAALAHGANHLNTLVSQAMDQLRSAGVGDPAALLRLLLEASLDNTLAYGDAALTGPVARGDVETIRAHLGALEHDIVPSYVALARATVERATSAGRISVAAAEAIEAVLDEAMERVA